MYIVPHNQLLERREKANLLRLNKYMTNDSTLRKLLTTRIEKLPPVYHYLVAGSHPKLRKHQRFYGLMLHCFNVSNCETEFFISAGKVVGFIGYESNYDEETRSNCISDIVLFSCTLTGSGAVLAHDSLELLGVLRMHYAYIRWSAFVKNRVAISYDRIARQYRGCYKDYKDEYNNSMRSYCLPGTKPLPSKFSNWSRF